MLSALGRGGSSVSRTTTFRNRPILEKYRELHTADGLSIVSFQCKSQQGLKLLLYKEPLLLFSRSAMGPSVWNGEFSFFSFVFFGFLSSSVGSPLDSGQGWRWQSEHMASKLSPTHRWRWCWAKRCRKFIRRNLFWKTTTLLQIVCVIFQDFALKWQAVALHVIFEEMQNCSLAGALGFPGALNGVLESLLLRYRCTFLISWFSYTWSYQHSPRLLHSFKGILCLTASLCFLFYELLCILHL